MIKDAVVKVRETLKGYPEVRIIAATKYLDIEKTKEIIEAGITEIGENRTDVLLEKYEALSSYDNIVWHFLGVLQVRKVRFVIDKIDYLHSLDSISLASEINKRSKKTLKCFVQVNISSEPNKAGLDETKVISFVKSLAKYRNIEVVGLMTIAKLTFDEQLLTNFFKTMKKLQKEVQALNLGYAPCQELSMGMSNDYLIAVSEGATTVRLGRIFLE